MILCAFRSHQKIHQARLNQIASQGAPLASAAAQIIKPNQARAVDANMKKYKAEKKKAARPQRQLRTAAEAPCLWYLPIDI